MKNTEIAATNLAHWIAYSGADDAVVRLEHEGAALLVLVSGRGMPVTGCCEHYEALRAAAELLETTAGIGVSFYFMGASAHATDTLVDQARSLLLRTTFHLFEQGATRH